MKLLADAVLSPDEVWANIEYQHAKGRAVVRRRYVARFMLPGEQLPALAVFEHGGNRLGRYHRLFQRRRGVSGAAAARGVAVPAGGIINPRRGHTGGTVSVGLEALAGAARSISTPPV